MAKKVLGQLACAATTNETVYTVPAGKSTVVSTLAVCNRSDSGVAYRIAIRPAGATLDVKHYIAYDVTIAGHDAHFLTIGLTLAETDVVTAYAAAGSAISVNLFGDES